MWVGWNTIISTHCILFIKQHKHRLSVIHVDFDTTLCVWWVQEAELALLCTLPSTVFCCHLCCQYWAMSNWLMTNIARSQIIILKVCNYLGLHYQLSRAVCCPQAMGWAHLVYRKGNREHVSQRKPRGGRCNNSVNLWEYLWTKLEKRALLSKRKWRRKVQVFLTYE